MIQPIYLASPYTHKSGIVQEFRYRAARENAARLLGQYHIYSPIVHCHWMAEVHDMPGDFDFWEKYDKAMIATLPVFAILDLPGWRASKGVMKELAFAEDLGKECLHFTPFGEATEVLKKIS